MSAKSRLNKHKKFGTEPWRNQGVAQYRHSKYREARERKPNRVLMAKQAYHQRLVDMYSYSTRGRCKLCKCELGELRVDEPGYSYTSTTSTMAMGHTCRSCRLVSVPICFGCTINLNERTLSARRILHEAAREAHYATINREYLCEDCSTHD